MTLDQEKLERILAAAAEVYSEQSAVIAGRRAIAKRADLPMRTVSEVGSERVDLLREVVARLPFPPVARHLAQQAADPVEPALQALMRASREVLGDPAAAWDPLELQAIVVAPYDEAIRKVIVDRLNLRWDAAQQVVHQLRGDSHDSAFDDESAALHVMAVGLGLAMLAPLAPRWSDGKAWAALVARLLQALAPDEIEPTTEASTRWRARVTIASSPAAMARLLRVLSLLGVHVVSLFTAPLPDDEQLVDLFLSSPAEVDRATIAHGMSSMGSDAIVVRGREEDAGDIATRVLYLSEQLVQDPEATPRAVADLVLADAWEVTTATVGEDSSKFVLRLQWTPERHVILRRVRAPFTQIERNRASAMLAVVAALAEVRGESSAYGWRENLPDGRSISVRLSRPEDVNGVEAMHERSSKESRYQRYFTPMNEWREDNLRRISGGHRGTTLVVTDVHETVIALGNVFPMGPQDTDTAEIALIVDDAWQGAGVGLILTEHLIDVARQMGFERLIAYVLADNRAMLGLLERTSVQWSITQDHDLGHSVTCLVATL